MFNMIHASRIFMLTHISDPEFYLKQRLESFKLTNRVLKHFYEINMCLCNSLFFPGLRKPLWPPLDCSVLHNIPSPNYPSSSPQIHLCYSVSVSSEESPPDPSAETLKLHAQKRHAEKSKTPRSVSRTQIM